MSTLAEAADFLSGGTPNKGESNFWGGSIPWYSASNMDRRFLAGGEPKITEEGLKAGSRIAPKGATLLLVRGSGLFNNIPICFADEPVAFNQDVKAICAKPHVDPTFLHFWLESLRPKLHENIGVTGIGAGKFDTDFLKALPFPDLPKEEQKEIGLYAASFDRMIDINRQMNETLEAIVRLFFKDWFVDFGPTRAKAEGRQPYLAPELWSLFPDALDDEDKPVGWKEGTLTDIASLNPNVWSSKTAPSSVEYVDLANTKWGEIEQTQLFAWEKAPSRARRILHPGDTIIGTVRPGNGSFALVGASGLTGSTGFAVLRPQRPEYREAVYIAATSLVTIKTLSRLADGAAYPAVRPEVVALQPIILPDQNCLKAFSDQTSPLIDLVLANRQKSRTLAQTRDMLLPKLISGEIYLRDAERIIGKVA